MRNVSILCVEDHRDTADALGRLLRLWGYDATVVYSYQDAMGAAKARRFDLLVSDVELPDGDGCALLHEILALYPIRAVAISGYGMPKDVERCLRSGYLYHLLKPTTAQRVKEVLSSVARIVCGEGPGTVLPEHPDNPCLSVD